MANAKHPPTTPWLAESAPPSENAGMNDQSKPRRWGFDVYTSIRLMNPEALEQALEQADPNAMLNNGMTALTMCARHNEDDEPEMARIIIASGARLDQRDSKGDSPLDACLDADNSMMLRVLLAYGAKTKTTDADGLDALMISCKLRRWDCALTLLKFRADPAARSFEGKTALILLAEHSIHAHGFDKTLPQPASISLAKQLLAQGADIDARDDAGWTPLMFAAWRGNADLTHLFLDEGASALAAPGRNETPVILANRMGHADLAQTIRQRISSCEKDILLTSIPTAAVQSTPTPRL